MNTKWIGPKPEELDLTDSSVRIYAEEVAVASDEKLLEFLTEWKPGTHSHLITQAEIDRRKQVVKDARETIGSVNGIPKLGVYGRLSACTRGCLGRGPLQVGCGRCPRKVPRVGRQIEVRFRSNPALQLAARDLPREA